ncbi:MAG: nuclear transport factor 2 family protein [Pirellulales bacterium]|nr:nuclear transport factor 2 family protein [Pirellulales bacterium]
MWRAMAMAALVSAAARGVMAQDAAKSQAEVQAVRAAAQAYVAAFNTGDATKLGASFADDVEYVTSAGETVQGKAAVLERVAAFFKANPKAKLELKIDSIQVVSADVAIERGATVVTLVDGTVEQGAYVAMYARRGGKWLLVHVEDLPGKTAGREERLAALDWLVGTWIDQDAEATVKHEVQWAGNRSFLTAQFTLMKGEDVQMTGMQIIGWDPLAQEIRSWVFDSEGGFGEGRWAQEGDRWVVTTTGVTADGGLAASVNTYSKVDDSTYTWESRDREVDGEMLPDIEPVKVVRQPAAKGAAK